MFSYHVKLKIFLVACVLALLGQASFAVETAPILHARLEGTLDYTQVEYIRRVLSKAETLKSPAVILEINAKGGHPRAVKQMVRNLLETEVPVVGYVTPKGGKVVREASFVGLATHLLAVSPGASLEMLDPHARLTEDAYPAGVIRFYHWFSQPPSEFVQTPLQRDISSQMKDAPYEGLFHVFAESLSDLLQRVEGRQIRIHGDTRVLSLRGHPIQLTNMHWIEQVLHRLAKTPVIFALLLMGLWGLAYVLVSPKSMKIAFMSIGFLLLAWALLEILELERTGLLAIIFGAICLMAELNTEKITFRFWVGLAGVMLGCFMLFHWFCLPELALTWQQILWGILITGILFWKMKSIPHDESPA